MLGANDGIVSIASLLVGVAAADASRTAVVTAGVAGLVTGAMSMEVGEYVSVSSQRDTERGDLTREAAELATDPDAELDELTQIYLDRGLSAATARQVAMELTARDPLAAGAYRSTSLSVLAERVRSRAHVLHDYLMLVGRFQAVPAANGRSAAGSGGASGACIAPLSAITSLTVSRHGETGEYEVLAVGIKDGATELFAVDPSGRTATWLPADQIDQYNANSVKTH